MPIWIFERLAAVGLVCALAGCDASGGLPFLQGGADRAETERLTQITLAGGSVELIAPDGYCIDRQSLRRRQAEGFAVMARCDTLGVRGFFGGAPLALITATVVPQSSAPPDVAALRAAAGGAEVLSSEENGPLTLVLLGSGPHDLAGVSKRHWRGAVPLNGHLVGLSLYAPAASEALRQRGADILTELARRTAEASRQTELQATPSPGVTAAKSENLPD